MENHHYFHFLSRKSLICIEKSYLVFPHPLPYVPTLITSIGDPETGWCASLCKDSLLFCPEPSCPPVGQPLRSPTQGQAVGEFQGDCVCSPFLHAAWTGLCGWVWAFLFTKHPHSFSPPTPGVEPHASWNSQGTSQVELVPIRRLLQTSPFLGNRTLLCISY